jgi:hypothetical protein
MMRALRKYQYHIFLFTIGFFLLASFVGFGGYFFGSKGSPNDPVAEVNGEKIPIHLFYSHYSQALRDVKAASAMDQAARQQKREEILRDLIQSVVFEQEADRYGIEVPDQQVAVSIAQIAGFRDKDGRFDPRLYVQALGSQLHMSPHDFEEEQRRSIAFFKLRWLVQSAIKVTDAELNMAYAFQHPGKSFAAAPAKDQADFRDELWKQKVLWCFNQWFGQISQRTRVKMHPEALEGAGS